MALNIGRVVVTAQDPRPDDRQEMRDGPREAALREWVTVNTSGSLEAGKAYMADVSGGTITLALPAAPALGDTIVIVDATGDFSPTTAVVINRNGNPINGEYVNYILNVERDAVELIFNPATGWRLIHGGPNDGGTF